MSCQVARPANALESVKVNLMNQALTPATAMLLVTAPLLWAGNAVVGRLVQDLVPPITLNLLRWVLAFVLLLPFAYKVLRPDSTLWPHWRRYALLGLLGIGCYNALQYLALQTSSPINVTLVAALPKVCACWHSSGGCRLFPSTCQKNGEILMPSDVSCSLAAQARAIPLQTPPARFPSWPSATPSVVLLLTPEPKAPAAQSLTQPPPVAAADSLSEPLPAGSPAEGHTVAPRGRWREVAPLPAASHQWGQRLGGGRAYCKWQA